MEALSRWLPLFMIPAGQAIPRVSLPGETAFTLLYTHCFPLVGVNKCSPRRAWGHTVTAQLLSSPRFLPEYQRGSSPLPAATSNPSPPSLCTPWTSRLT